MNEQFKDRLFSASERYVRKLNFKFSEIATTDLKAFINRGVDRMTESELRDETKKDLAEKNLMKVIEAMVGEAGKRKLHENLDYKTFSDARMSICPCWPFC